MKYMKYKSMHANRTQPFNVSETLLKPKLITTARGSGVGWYAVVLELQQSPRNLQAR